MMKFDSLAGRLIRLPLRLIPRDSDVRVRSGLNQGFRWRTGSATHGCWIGSYEAEVQRLPEFVRDGMTCYDIGANAGFYTLALARLAGATGRVVAMEPLPENAANLLHHVRINHLPQVTIIQTAVSDEDGLAGFERHESPSMGHLAPAARSRDRVATARLDTLIERDDVPAPGFVKIDVEGAELAVLRGARATLSRHRPTLLIAFHGDDLFRDCLNLLSGHGYLVRNLRDHPLQATSPATGEAIATHPSRS